MPSPGRAEARECHSGSRHCFLVPHAWKSAGSRGPASEAEAAASCGQGSSRCESMLSPHYCLPREHARILPEDVPRHLDLALGRDVALVKFLESGSGSFALQSGTSAWVEHASPLASVRPGCTQALSRPRSLGNRTDTEQIGHWKPWGL